MNKIISMPAKALVARAESKTHIITEGIIKVSLAEVYNYVTTPANWPQWHPSSLGVFGAANHSLEVGEQVTEKFRVAGREGVAIWTVVEKLAPHTWTIQGSIENSGNGGIIRYTLSSISDGTHFRREFEYAFSNPLLNLLNWLYIRRKVTAESREAMRRLKEKLES